MTLNYLTRATAIAVCSLFASMVQAYDNQAGTGFYLSGSYGSSDLDLQEVEDYTGIKLSSPKGTAFTFGYRVNQFIAVETGYTDFGDAEADESYREEFGPYFVAPGYSEIEEVVYNGDVTVSASSFRLGLLATTDIWEAFSAGVRVGFHNWEADVSARLKADSTWYLIDDLSGERVESADFGGDFTDRESDSLDGSDAYYGITGSWRTGNVLVSLDYTQFVMDDIEPTMTALTIGYDF